MNKRNFESKKRNSGYKRRRSVIGIVPEGKNVTETLYFDSFISASSNFIIKVFKTGGNTDIQSMVNTAKHEWDNNKLDCSLGDKIFVVLDLDCSDEKASKLRNIFSKIPDWLNFTVSNPCFELWYLLHFEYSTKPYHNSKEMLKDLRKYIPDYSKNKDVTGLLFPSLDKALANAEKLVENYKYECESWPSTQHNPRTDMHILMNLIKANYC